MKTAIALTVVCLLILDNCASQEVQAIKVTLLFKLPIYDKNCNARIPDYYVNSQYYDYSQYDMFTFDTSRWCAIRTNTKKINLPKFDIQDRGNFDYRVLNDSIAVFFFSNSYHILYYVNFKNGARVRTDTLVANISHSHEIEDEKFIRNKYSFSGGAFAADNFYYLSSTDNKSQKSLLFRVSLIDQKIDTIYTKFVFENYTQLIKSSRKYLVADAQDVFNLSSQEYKSLKSNATDEYRLLDFINDDAVLLHHSKKPHQFALASVVNGKVHLFQLDQNIFRLENIRKEEILKVEDGPSDGLNKLEFRYFTCRNGENQILISFADKNNNRLVYQINFKEDMLKKLR